MSSGYVKWSDVRANGREVDPRTAGDQAAGKTVARERREAYVRGHQLAEMRAAVGVTQAGLANALGVSKPASPRSNMGRSLASTSSELMSWRWAEAST